MAKHKKEKAPRWTRPNPGAGRHGVPDKAAKKVGDKWEDDTKNKPKESK
jgi:hypothetical protein